MVTNEIDQFKIQNQVYTRTIILHSSLNWNISSMLRSMKNKQNSNVKWISDTLKHFSLSEERKQNDFLIILSSLKSGEEQLLVSAMIRSGVVVTMQPTNRRGIILDLP